MKDYIPKIGERVEAASRLVEKCNKLLDVGCGDGVICRFISNRVKQIYGVDNSIKDLKIAKKRNMKVKLIDIDREKLSYKTNYFDAVTCLDVIEHVRDPIDLLLKIRRVLKTNGRLILATPNIRFTNHLYDLIIRGRFPKTSVDTTIYDGGHIHFLTYGDVIDLFSKTGFKVIQITGIINKARRGWKGRILEIIIGKKFMLEFRTPGILVVAVKS